MGVGILHQLLGLGAAQAAIVVATLVYLLTIMNCDGRVTTATSLTNGLLSYCAMMRPEAT